jgi:hypothetical protein
MTKVDNAVTMAPVGPLGPLAAGPAQARAAAELAEAVAMMGVHRVAVEIAGKAKMEAQRKSGK